MKEIFDEGESTLDKELCLINILQTLQKLRAGMSVVI